MRAFDAVWQRALDVVRPAFVLTCALGAMASEAPAQDPTMSPRLPKVGSRVRLTSASIPGGRITGILQQVSADSVVVRPGRDSGSLVIGRNDLTQVEVRVGEDQAERLGTVFGIAGAVGGAAVYVNWCKQNADACLKDALGDRSSEDPCNLDCENNDAPLSVPTFLIFGGAMVGAALGYILAAPHWTPMGMPTRIGIAPLGPRGVVIGASINVGSSLDGLFLVFR